MTASLSLIHYNAARAALAQAVRIDEVKQIRDLAVAAQVYAQQAQDYEMINNATELRERAEREAGVKLIELRERGERDDGRGNRNPVLKSQTATPKLADIGINKTQSSRWQAKARMTDEQFERHVTNAKRRAATAGHSTTEQKQQRRAEREAELATVTAVAAANLGTKLYGVIYADPPWRFEPRSRVTGMDRAADNHYPTMSLEAIVNMQAPAAEDCVLFLWATVPMLKGALIVMEAWGFEYKSHFVWVKHNIGNGYWVRNRHELLLIGTRGNIPAPAPGEQYESVIEARAGSHSQKPFHFHEIIEDMFPNLPRVELFARRQWTGWDTWGNEVPEATGEVDV